MPIIVILDVLTDKKQVLYKRCIAIDSTSLRQCHKPVLEILQDKPYCRTHATTFLEVIITILIILCGVCMC